MSFPLFFRGKTNWQLASLIKSRRIMQILQPLQTNLTRKNGTGQGKLLLLLLLLMQNYCKHKQTSHIQ
jgi:hypothetical protein